MFAISEQQSMGRVNTMLQDQNAIFGSVNKLGQINQPIEQPDYLGAAMNLAGSAMSIYKGTQTRKLEDAQLKLTNAKLTEMGIDPDG